MVRFGMLYHLPLVHAHISHYCVPWPLLCSWLHLCPISSALHPSAHPLASGTRSIAGTVTSSRPEPACTSVTKWAGTAQCHGCRHTSSWQKLNTGPNVGARHPVTIQALLPAAALNPTLAADWKGFLTKPLLMPPRALSCLPACFEPQATPCALCFHRLFNSQKEWVLPH